jgi:hypothetical protein
VLNAVFHRVSNIGPLVKGCSITGGTDGLLPCSHMTILTEWLDFSGGGFCAWIEILPGGIPIRFWLRQVSCVGPVAVVVVLCASVSEGKKMTCINYRPLQSWAQQIPGTENYFVVLLLSRIAT